jgi:hypothetical protein
VHHHWHTQLRGGQALAQLAQARGTTEQAVVSAALASAAPYALPALSRRQDVMPIARST